MPRDLYSRTHLPVIVTLRCRAWRHQGVRHHKLRVGSDRTVRPFDAVAGFYTPNHDLSPRTITRAIKAATAIRRGRSEESPECYLDDGPEHLPIGLRGVRS